MERALYLSLWKEISEHKAMVFLAGPRQAGKTTLARMIADSFFTNRVYLNWDLDTHKRRLLEDPAFFEKADRKDASKPLVIFDEIHKHRRWKNYLKGIYDQFSAQYQFLVLGSGRLNLFQKGGDSLAGRYFLFTLWPLTLAELAGRRRPHEAFLRDPLRVEGNPPAEPAWEQLARLSGFPEPYLSGKETVYRRWSRAYHQQLIREDIRNMTGIRNIDDVETLFSLLPSRVGSPLSMDSLARDLQVSFNSVRNWLELFERFFLTFRIPPWTRKVSRAITKEKKLYLCDCAGILSEAAKFENMAALELLRAVSNWNDLGLADFTLHYVRTREKEEVDFLVARDGAPLLLVETKLSEEAAAKGLLKLQAQLRVPAVQLVNKPGVYRILSNGPQKILVITASRWLAHLP